jgi:hypothetical protein
MNMRYLYGLTLEANIRSPGRVVGRPRFVIGPDWEGRISEQAEVCQIQADFAVTDRTLEKCGKDFVKS